MEWTISISGKKHRVTLPDTLPDNMSFPAAIDGRSVQLKWQRSTKALFILDETKSRVWTSINLRSRSVSKFAGESDLIVNTEFSPAGAHGSVILDATASIYIPGQEAREGSAATKPKVIRSQITGKVLKVLAKVGDSVNAGDALMIIEAMKMENRVVASAAGIIESIKAQEGDTVSTGAELVRFKKA
jgi:glutaconyl-CoA/methylmalonyl-CoA decarboxylase subunit gamma